MTFIQLKGAVHVDESGQQTLVGSPLHQGYTYGGTIHYDTDGTFSKANHPGLRAIRYNGEFILVDDLAESEDIEVDSGPNPGDYAHFGTVSGGGNTFMEVEVPQTHRDLIIHWHGDHDGAAQFELCTLRFNTTSDSSDYRYAVQYKNLAGVDGNTSSASNTFAVVGYVSDSSVSSSGVITIPNYTGAGVILGFTFQGWASRGAADNNSRTWTGGGRRTRVQVDSVILGVNGDWSTDSRMSVYGVGKLGADVELWF